MFEYESSLAVITIKNNYYAVLNFVKLYKIYTRKSDCSYRKNTQRKLTQNY